MNTKYNLYSLYDEELVCKYFRKLFEGNCSIRFDRSCGFNNGSGSCIIGMNAFANDKTTNYVKGNTVNFIIISLDSKTISMYPVEASKVEGKFNGIIRNYSNINKTIKINH